MNDLTNPIKVNIDGMNNNDLGRKIEDDDISCQNINTHLGCCALCMSTCSYKFPADFLQRVFSS